MLHYLTARAVSAKLAARELSAVELMQATLARIAAVNPSLNAIVSLRSEEALLAEAAAADAAPRKGWLHGVPMAVKDLVATKGIRTTHGSPLFADHVPDADELLPARLKAAGAILIGKTNTPEFGLGSNTFNPVHGITPNAYDLSKSCGGSSGGAGVALAARMVAVADGSDMMGSLRNPAAWSNVYGMRPTHGLVPDNPAGEMFLHPLATLGPMARNPLDIAALLQTLAGGDPRTPLGRGFDADRVVPGLRGKRIGWLGDWGGAFPYAPGISALTEDALRVMEAQGAVVEPVAPPFEAEAIFQAWSTLRSWAVSAKLRPLWSDPEKRKRLKGTAEWEVARGQAFTAMELHAASEVASEWYRAAAALFARYDALVLPSAQFWPFDRDTEYPTEIAGREMDTYHRWMQVMVPVSLIGLPCVNLPAGFGVDEDAAGLPMGLQLFGPRGADAALLGMAEAYHQATDWPGARPPQV